jgi:hypothetical protein
MHHGESEVELRATQGELVLEDVAVDLHELLGELGQILIAVHELPLWSPMEMLPGD